MGTLETPLRLDIQLHWGWTDTIPSWWIEAFSPSVTLDCSVPFTGISTFWCEKRLLLRVYETSKARTLLFNPNSPWAAVLELMAGQWKRVEILNQSRDMLFFMSICWHLELHRSSTHLLPGVSHRPYSSVHLVVHWFAILISMILSLLVVDDEMFFIHFELFELVHLRGPTWCMERTSETTGLHILFNYLWKGTHSHSPLSSLSIHSSGDEEKPCHTEALQCAGQWWPKEQSEPYRDPRIDLWSPIPKQFLDSLWMILISGWLQIEDKKGCFFQLPRETSTNADTGKYLSRWPSQSIQITTCPELGMAWSKNRFAGVLIPDTAGSNGYDDYFTLIWRTPRGSGCWKLLSDPKPNKRENYLY